MTHSNRPDIKAHDLEGLNRLFKEMGQPGFRAGQVYNWLFHKNADSFQDMTNLPKDLRALLERSFSISCLRPEKTRISQDGTQKLLFRLDDGESIESVLIPERDHWTLCASTQVGCAMDCSFCLTGKTGLIRHLEPVEIISQVQAVARIVAEQDSAGPQVTNIVFMGMGEPLNNLENLLSALGVILDPKGLAFAWRRVTASTVGLIPQMNRLISETKVRLAISLNAPDDETRTRIMPVNRRYPLADLIAACRKLPLRPGERITFEYVLLDGVNDSLAQARDLVRLLHPIAHRSKVNLIPFNEHPESEFKRPSRKTVEAFRDRLLKSNLTAMVRRSMGQDILAACGQLRGEQGP
jgi:23S rRNA (adenine2503-C2)-methyltransferase